jgi:hypothetical protein
MRKNDEDCVHIDSGEVDYEDAEYRELYSTESDEYDSELCQILSETGMLNFKGKASVYKTDIHESEILPADLNRLHEQQIVMEKYRRQKRPAGADLHMNKQRKLNDGSAAPETTVNQFPLEDAEIIHHPIQP